MIGYIGAGNEMPTPPPTKNNIDRSAPTIDTIRRFPFVNHILTKYPNNKKNTGIDKPKVVAKPYGIKTVCGIIAMLNPEFVMLFINT